MAATTQTKTKTKSNYLRRKERGIEDEMFVRNLSYAFAYKKSYDEVVQEIYLQVQEENAEKAKTLAAEQAKVLAAGQAKVLAAEQAKVLAAEQAVNTIKTMFQKTGWTADKIADIGALPLDLVQKTLNELGKK